MEFTLDHLVEVTDDLDAAEERHAERFGRAPDWASVSQEGTRTLEWRTARGAVELLAPRGELPQASLGLKSLVLGTADVEAARARLGHAGLEPSEISRAEGADVLSGAVRRWRRFRCPDVHLGGLKLFVVQREERPSHGDGAPLESVLVGTGDEGALARLFCETLGLTPQGNGYALGRVTLEVRRTELGSPHRILGFRLAGEGPFA